MKKKPVRYKITLEKNGLNDYESSVVSYVFESSSPQDALRRIDVVYERCERIGKRIPYNSKMFLEALAISAEADVHNLWFYKENYMIKEVNSFLDNMNSSSTSNNKVEVIRNSSRLSCQINLSEELDGIELELAPD